jgi:hypothetical protein
MPTQVLQYSPRMVAEMMNIATDANSGVSAAKPKNWDARRGAARPARRR